MHRKDNSTRADSRGVRPAVSTARIRGRLIRAARAARAVVRPIGAHRRARLIRVVLPLVAVAGGSLAAFGAGGAAARRAVAAATPRCVTSGLVVWLNNEPGGGATGSTFYKLDLTNLSGHSCTLRGYPGVSAVDLAGHRVGAPGGREHGAAPHTVTLANGASASAVLRIVEAGNFSASRCHMVTAAGLRVYPPGQSSSRLVPFPFPACSRTTASILAIRAVQKQ